MPATEIGKAVEVEMVAGAEVEATVEEETEKEAGIEIGVHTTLRVKEKGIDMVRVKAKDGTGKGGKAGRRGK